MTPAQKKEVEQYLVGQGVVRGGAAQYGGFPWYVSVHRGTFGYRLTCSQCCDFLCIPIKGIFSRNEPKPLSPSPCIINLDDFGNLGTHCVCCWRSKDGTYEYFDSFGLPPPLEWEKEMSVHGKKHFFRNDNQIQWEQSVRRVKDTKVQVSPTF